MNTGFISMPLINNRMLLVGLILIMMLVCGCEPQAIAVVAATETQLPVFTDTPRSSETPTKEPSAIPTEEPTVTPTPEPTHTPVLTPTLLTDSFAHYPSGESALVWSFYLHMQSATTGWAILRESQESRVKRIMRTTDGGASWYDVTPLNPPGGVSQAFFLDGQHAWALQPGEQQAVVWQTTDGGQTWKPGQPLDIVDLSNTSLTFLDAQNGWLFYGQAIGMHKVPTTVYQSTDGGLTWQIIYADEPGQAGELFSGYKSGYVFQDGTTGWAGVASPYVLPEVVTTRDGGYTWEAQFLPLPSPYTESDVGECDMVAAPFVFPTQTVMIVSKCWIGDETHRYLYLTVDGGQAWSANRIPGSEGAVEFASAQEGWAVSIDGSERNVSELYRTYDGGLTWMFIRQVNWWTNQLDFVNDQEGWAVARSGENMAFLHTSDGGETWQQLQPLIVP